MISLNHMISSNHMAERSGSWWRAAAVGLGLLPAADVAAIRPPEQELPRLAGGQESWQKPMPREFNDRNLPALGNHIYQSLGPEKYAATAAELLRLVAGINPRAKNALKAFVEVLTPADQQQLAQRVFELARLSAMSMRNNLVGQELLDEDEQGYLEEHATYIGLGSEFGDYLDESIADMSPAEKWKFYQHAKALLSGTVTLPKLPVRPVAVAGLQASTVREPRPEAPASGEKKGLPPGAEGLDECGQQPYGWGFRGHAYLPAGQERFNFNDLSRPFAGKNVDGTPHENLRLRQAAYNAWIAMGAEYQKAAQHDPTIAQHGWFACEAGRTLKDQIAMKKKRGKWAATPRNSEHLLYTTVDGFAFNRVSMFQWLYEPAVASRNGIPLLGRHGWIPTVPGKIDAHGRVTHQGEPWHVRYVGPTAAAQFWRLHGKDVILRFSHMTVPDGPIAKK